MKRFKVTRVPGLLPSMNNGDAHRVKFEVFSDESDDFVVISGVVDWQNGMDIWQSENIDPSEWMTYAYAVYLATIEARKMIGAKWCHNEITYVSDKGLVNG